MKDRQPLPIVFLCFLLAGIFFASLHSANIAEAPVKAENAESTDKNADNNPSSSSFVCQNCSATHEKNGANKGNGWEKWWNDPMAVFSCAVAVFAGFQIFWMRRTVRSAEKTAQRQMRAYVMLNYDNSKGPSTDKGAIILTFPEKTKQISEPLKAICKIRNAGQTPAHEVTTYGVFEVLDYPQSENWIEPPIDRSKPTGVLMLGPQQEAEFTSESKLALLPTIMQVKPGKTLYLHGRIEYRDIFKRPRFTNFCFVILPVNDTWTPHAAVRGNDADHKD